MPSSRFGRLWQYGGLATSMAFGAVGESLRRATTGGESTSGSLMLSAGNMERLVAKLSKMRGAALKLGQMMSFQGPSLTPNLLFPISADEHYKIQKFFLPLSTKCYSVYRIARTTCPPRSETRFWQAILDPTGKVFFHHLMKCPWQPPRSGKFTAQFLNQQANGSPSRCNTRAWQTQSTRT